MKGKVMVVDDEQHTVRLVRRVLEREGYEVKIANDAQQAIDVLSGFVADVLLLDIMMPGRPPMDVIERLRQDGRKTRVLYFSALKSGNDATDRLMRNLISDDDTDYVVGYVEKPFDNQDMLDKVREAIERGSVKT